MNFLGLTIRTRRFAVALPLGLVLTLTGVPSMPAQAATGSNTAHSTSMHQRSTVNNDAKTAHRTTTSSRSTASDVYNVPTSYVDKKKANCRRMFTHRHNRIKCKKAEGATAVTTKWGVTKFRSWYFGIKSRRNARLAKKCNHHRHWCGHTPKFRFMSIPNCGNIPWAPPTWHFRLMCLRWRSDDYHSRWLKLALFRNNPVPQTATANLRLANALIGPNARPSISMSHHWFSLSGPYETFTMNRSATISAHNQVNLADGALVLANGLCVALGFAAKLKPVALGCAAYVTASINGVKNDINQAFNDGTCVQFKLFYLYLSPAPLGPIVAIRQGLDPTSVVSCPSGRTAQRQVQP
jgi:hypothetical protein